jgi:hypothetical protein
MDDILCFVDGAPTLHRGGSTNDECMKIPIQIYLNIMTLIDLNAFGVAGAHVQIYLY